MKTLRVASLIAGAAALFASGAAMAGLNVGINLGVPAPVYVAPAPVYAPPPPPVYAPPPVLTIGWYGDRYWDGRRYWGRNEWYRRHPGWDRDHGGWHGGHGGPGGPGGPGWHH